MEKLIEEQDEAYFTAKEDEYEYGKAQVDELEDTYIKAKNEEKNAKASMEQTKHALQILYGQGHEPRKITVTNSTRKGNVDLHRLQEDLDLMDYQIDKYRKKAIKSVTYKIKATL